ncbi:MAG: hypothetical protein LBT48_08930 [Prevotellaceae bacterium]|jgi:hypothetical protein|nr:hypothetical protein [Prevotellaceae bacterium]
MKKITFSQAIIRFSVLFTSAIVLLLVSSCHYCDDCEGLQPSIVNPNIVNLSEQRPDDLRNNPYTIWVNDNTLYTINPLARITIDNDFRVTQYDMVGTNIRCDYFTINPAKTKMLLINNAWKGVSLKEYDLTAGTMQDVLDSTYNVRSALYYNDDTIIYVSLAWDDETFKDHHTNYYLYNRLTQESVLLFTSGPNYAIMDYHIIGFDVHLQQNKLLIPTRKKGTSSSLIIEYDINMRKADTLNTSFVGELACVCYNTTGDEILYSLNYYDTEIGILNVPAMTKKPLDVNTQPYVGGSDNFFPNWSPNEQHIVYASFPVAAPPGGVGKPEICILKNINH